MTTPDTPTFKWLNENAEPYCPGKEVCTMECNDNCPVYANDCGCKLLLEGRIEEAKILFRKAINNTPDLKYCSAWCNLGTTYKEMGYIRDAFEAYKNAFYINQGNKTVRSGLSSSYVALKNYDKTMERYRQIWRGGHREAEGEDYCEDGGYKLTFPNS